MFLIFLESKMLFSKMLGFPTPVNLSFWWNLGFLLNILIMLQLLVGIFLSCMIDISSFCFFYKHLMFKEGGFCWFLISLHTVLPNFIFILMYLHIFKSLIYPIYFMFTLWLTGFIIFIIFVIMTFTGYSLVFSAMSYWAILVACEMMKFIFGDKISNLVFFSEENSINNITIYKLFTMHYIMSILVLIFIFLHMKMLHKSGSSNGGFFSYCDYFKFSTILFLKDLVFSIFLYLFMFYFIFFESNKLLSGDGNVSKEKSDTLDMSVEWYLSIFFIFLSSLEDKLFGVVSVLLFLLCILFTPLYSNLWGLKLNFKGLTLINLFMFMIMVMFSFNFFSSYSWVVCFFMFLLLNNILSLYWDSMLYFKMKKWWWE